MLRRLLTGIAIFGLAGCDAGSSSGTDEGLAPQSLKGCTLDAGVSAKTAPGGYFTNGATVCKADGTPHLFHGIDRPSMEWDSAGEWNNSSGIPRSDFEAMASWHANVVRIALNQDFWLSGAALYDASYSGVVDQAVKDAEASGLDVILDLHWSDRGNLAVSNIGGGQNKADHADQQPMADTNSKQFWLEVANKYKGDGHVLFELYNEPHDISWQTWLRGGTVAEYQTVGMQDLYDAVRSTGADNVVIAGGLSYAFDLSGVAGNAIQGYNIMYATHPYYPQDPAGAWDTKFGYLAARDIAPVIATEFGDHTASCNGDWNNQLVAYSDKLHISFTAWAWWAGDCNFPSLISDWDYTPTLQGQAIKTALLAYPDEPAGNPSAAGTGGTGGAGAGGKGGARPLDDAGAAGESGVGEGGSAGDLSN